MQQAILKRLISSEVRTLSYAEAQIAKRLAQIASSVPAGATQDILNERVKISTSRAAPLKTLADKVVTQAGVHAASCVGINAILDEAENVASEGLEPDALHAELTLGVQRIIAYQLAGYRAVETYGTALGMAQDIKPLETSVAADKKSEQQLVK